MIVHPFDFCYCGTTYFSPGPTRLRPPLILMANGPYSSIEKKASSSFNSDRIFLTWVRELSQKLRKRVVSEQHLNHPGSPVRTVCPDPFVSSENIVNGACCQTDILLSQ